MIEFEEKGKIVADFLTKDLPDSLYRYRNANSGYFWDELDEAITSNRLFLSEAKKQNDPFEFRPVLAEVTLSEANKIVKQRFRNKPIISRERASELGGRKLSRSQFRRSIGKAKPSVQIAKLELEISKKTFLELPNKTKLACFSEDLHNIPMWGNYAGNHTGVCLEFELRLSSRSSTDEPIAFPVSYQAKRPCVGFDALYEFTSRGSKKQADKNLFNSVFEAFFLTKSEHWSYEREWRILESSDHTAGYRRVSSLQLSKIYCGVRMESGKLDQIMDRYGGKVEIWTSSVSAEDFSLVFTKVS